MFSRLILFLAVAISALIELGCAGPSTPFGALELAESGQAPTEQSDQETHDNSHFIPQIQVSPDRQVLHGSMDVTVGITDRTGITSSSTLELTFNGQKIKTTNEFLIPPGGSRRAFVAFKDIYLRPDKQNQIEFKYQSNPRAPSVRYQLKKPICYFDSDWPVGPVNEFPVSQDLKTEIETQARKAGVNPALVFGLIAQESAFDPKALSWAKALGLTQVTPIGDKQLKKTFPDWPRNEKIRELPVPALKMMLASGKIKDDWRLNPKLSIAGGITLLKEMNTYWHKKSVPILLSEGESPPEIEDLTLASYNSGALRVYEAIQEKGLSYLNHSDLREAKKYISRVKSYCYHYSQAHLRKVANR